MDHKLDTAKASVPIVVSAFSVFGIPLNEWVYIATIAYTVLLTIFLLRDKLLHPYLERRRQRETGEEPPDEQA